MLLADRLFLLMHDEYTGRSRLAPSATALGLAAGLIGELVLDQRLVVDGDGDLLAIGREWVADPVGNEVLGLVIGSPQHRAVRDWLRFLARSSVESVGARLARSGDVRQARRSRLLGGGSVWPAVDPNRAAWESVALANQLCAASGWLELSDRAVAGLVSACGLTGHVLWDVHHEIGRRRLPVVLDGLPDPLRHLVVSATAAVGEAVLVPR